MERGVWWTTVHGVSNRHEWVTKQQVRASSGRALESGFKYLCMRYWEDNRQEGQGSPNRGNRLHVSEFFSLKILCCHDDTWFHLNLTFLKFWANKYIFLMEMFVLSFKLVLPVDSEPTWQTSMLYLDTAPLIYVNETICMVICPSSRFKLIILWPRMNYLVPRLSQNTSYGWGAWCHSEF